ncbi:hypothetical protein Dtpsy_3153 [[Acidovorax] ebreus TPSY]|uniref:Uncharacterized protein n=1 Tax=Acidovorax ebreus (strain TPSY) TaxID=535289 RepID=A0A9J9UBX4_ACIET|nr:hypothetical protein Dtpsy_3153 [[Acidovorax] ebreus TPSY]
MDGCQRLKTPKTRRSRPAIDFPLRGAHTGPSVAPTHLHAQVLAPTGAEPAVPTGPPQPRNAYPLSPPPAPHARPQAGDTGHDLMPRHEGPHRIRQLAVTQMEVRAAHAAGLHRQQQLACLRNGARQLRQPQRLAGPVQHHGAWSVLTPGPCQPPRSACKCRASSCKLRCVRSCAWLATSRWWVTPSSCSISSPRKGLDANTATRLR